MTVTAKLYPSFLVTALNNDSLNFVNSTMDCKITLHSDIQGYNIEYDVEDSDYEDLNISFTQTLLANSEKDVQLNFERVGVDIKFWVDEVTWTDIADGAYFNRALVWLPFSFLGQQTKLLVAYIELSSTHTVDGSFKLRKATGGEIKITFS